MKSSKTRHVLKNILLFLCVIAVAGYIIGFFDGDARSALKEEQCRVNLYTLYDGLVKYVSQYGDVPRDKEGKASIAPLTETKIQNAIGIGPEILRCPADGNSEGPSYILNPNVSIHDFGPDSATVIACERTANHPNPNDWCRSPDRKGVTMVLIGNGAIAMMTLPLKDQEAWRRSFLSGDERACRISMKDGSTGCSSADAIWFINQEKGYVPNE